MKHIKDKLETLIKKYNEAYYNGESLISDSIYDELILKLKDIDPTHTLLKQVDAPQRLSKWTKVKHQIHMGSLFKCKNIIDVKKWLNKMDINRFVLELKYDGLSISLNYKEGIFIQAITRGSEGIEGEDITANVINMDFPKVLNQKVDITLRGEILLSRSNLKKINHILESKGKDLYSNTRNGASGIARNSKGIFSEYLMIKVYNSNIDFAYESDMIKNLEDLGFDVEHTMVKHLKDIEKVYNEYIKSKRDNLDFDIDGLVIKVDDVIYGKSLGITDNRPKWQMALKFPDKAYVTIVEDIIIQVGRTGVLTPVVMVEPTNIDNKIIRKASVHNIALMKKIKLTVGSVVELKVSGDVIPQIVRVIDGHGIYEHVPTTIEGFNVVEIGANLFVDGDTKGMIVKQITKYIKELGVEDISEKTIESLYQNGVVKSIPDIYNVTYNQLLNIDGFADKSAKQYIEKIKDTLKCRLNNFIVALGIDGLGNENTQKLLDVYPDVDIFNLDVDLHKVYNNPETVDKIMFSYNKKKVIINKLKTFITFKQGEDTLKGLSFCITGKLNFKTRDQYINIIKEKGGVYKSSVSKGLSYLITNDTKSESGKNKKAKQYGTQIINEETFTDMIGGAKHETLW